MPSCDKTRHSIQSGSDCLFGYDEPDIVRSKVHSVFQTKQSSGPIVLLLPTRSHVLTGLQIDFKTSPHKAFESISWGPPLP